MRSVQAVCAASLEASTTPPRQILPAIGRYPSKAGEEQRSYRPRFRCYPSAPPDAGIIWCVGGRSSAGIATPGRAARADVRRPG